MGKIVDVREVQKELDRAARDARHGSPDVRAGRFVHRNAGNGEFAEADRSGRVKPDKQARDKSKQAR